ncbi:MAG: hypothetical protein IT176_09220 [Acidobacteria bacterium]|nr:hypothetical protein [Acidobacteriota bacterium]
MIVTGEQMAAVRLERHAAHGDWNYTIDRTSQRRRRR